MFTLTFLGAGTISIITDKSPSKIVLDLFRQKRIDSKKNSFDFRNTESFAVVNDVSIPQNLVSIRKALYETIEEYSRNDISTKNNFGSELYNISEKQIAQEIAKRLLFVEYAKTQGIVVNDEEIDRYFAEMEKTRKKQLQENDPDALLAEQLDQELLEIIGFSKKEFIESFLKEQIVYVLYCEKYALSQSENLIDTPLESIESICNDLLSKSKIIYCK